MVKSIENNTEHAQFVEKLDKINLAMQGASDLSQMVNDVLDVMLTIFDCDRAWLVYPCDPKSTSWRTGILRTKPEYAIPGVELPMDAESIRIINAVLASDQPVSFGPGLDEPVPNWPKEKFNIQSQLSMAIYPKIDKPYMLGMHQCSYPRVWSEGDKRLFQEVGRRVADSLTTLLMYQNLQKSEEKYRRIIETSSEGIWMIDKDNKTTFVNPRMLSMLGYPESEILGQKLDKFIAPDDLDDHKVQMKERRNGKIGFYERHFIRKDNQIICASVSATPIFEKDEFVGSFAMLTDITERKKAEQRIQELSEMRSKFITIISHQLRTPLTVINWNLEMILKGDFGSLDDVQFRFIQGTYAASVKITNRIDDLITAMDIEEGRISFVQEDVFLDSICAAVMKDMSNMCDIKDIKCSYKCLKKDIPVFTGDAIKIRIAVTRLVENAIEYTKNGGKVSSLLNADKNKIRFEVSDTGIGVPVSEQHRLFTRFFRASNAFTMQPDAFGLGLYVTKNFIEQHGGKIGFKTTEGKGSTFWFELPVKR